MKEEDELQELIDFIKDDLIEKYKNSIGGSCKIIKIMLITLLTEKNINIIDSKIIDKAVKEISIKFIKEILEFTDEFLKKKEEE